MDQAGRPFEVFDVLDRGSPMTLRLSIPYIKVNSEYDIQTIYIYYDVQSLTNHDIADPEYAAVGVIERTRPRNRDVPSMPWVVIWMRPELSHIELPDDSNIAKIATFLAKIRIPIGSFAYIEEDDIDIDDEEGGGSNHGPFTH